jgi:hypothetical protein
MIGQRVSCLLLSSRPLSTRSLRCPPTDCTEWEVPPADAVCVQRGLTVRGVTVFFHRSTCFFAEDSQETCRAWGAVQLGLARRITRSEEIKLESATKG